MMQDARQMTPEGRDRWIARGLERARADVAAVFGRLLQIEADLEIACAHFGALTLEARRPRTVMTPQQRDAVERLAATMEEIRRRVRRAWLQGADDAGVAVGEGS